MSTIEVIDVPLTEIDADESFNCRGKITPIDVVDLAKDIQERGLIQPVTVSPQEKDGKKYRLLAGFRRYMAHKINENKTIPCIVRDDMTDEAEARFFNLAENLQRSDLTILQEARALLRLKALGVSEADAGGKLGKSRGWVQIRYMLLALPKDIQDEVEAGYITQTNIRELFAIYSTGNMEELYKSARMLKDAKIQGRSISVNPNKKKITARHHRKRPEIFEMMEQIQRALGNSFATRCMAWCSGEINDYDLLVSVSDEAVRTGKTYSIPDGMTQI